MPTISTRYQAYDYRAAPEPVPTPPRTATMRQWDDWKRAGFTKNDRKMKFREYIANAVDETSRYAGRFADLIYSPDLLKRKRDMLKLYGKVFTSMKNRKTGGDIRVEDAALVSAYSHEDRMTMVTMMRNSDKLHELLSGEGKKWFICQYTGFVTESAAAFHSRASNVWFSHSALGSGAFRRSNVMDDYILRGESLRYAPTAADYREGNWDWVSRAYVAENELRHEPRNSVYIPESVFDELGLAFSNEDGSIIGSYHSSRNVVGKIPSAYDKRKLPLLLGLELEVENATINVSTTALAFEWLKKFAAITINGKKYRYCATEHDGSLGNGFECVTGYTGLDVHEKALLPLKDLPFKGKLNSHNTTTCGLHVHIDRMSITPLHAYKLNLFINAKENQSLVYAVARRYNHDRYAAMAPKEGDGKIMGDYVRRIRADLFSMKGNTARTRKEFSNAMRARYSEVIKQANSNRYQAINFNNSKTLEYRLYRGSLKYETIMSCLEFTRATWLFSHQRSRTEMNIPEFLKFICLPENRQDTKFLREYLTLKGFDTKERTAVKIPRGRLTQKIIECEDAGDALPKAKVNKLHQLHGQAA